MDIGTRVKLVGDNRRGREVVLTGVIADDHGHIDIDGKNGRWSYSATGGRVYKVQALGKGTFTLLSNACVDKLDTCVSQ